MPNVPQTSHGIITGHSITIKVNGHVIGAIQSWTPNQSRDVTPVYELNTTTSGEPIDNIPGNVKDLTIEVARYDIFLNRFETAFGLDVGAPLAGLTMLSAQDSSLAIQEVFRSPDNTIEAYDYSGVWFTKLGRGYKSDDQRIVMVNASLRYLKKTGPFTAS